MSPTDARAALELHMLEGLVDCAYGLATTFCAAAKAEANTKHSLELLEGFHKCAFAVRMGIRLCMTLRAPPKAVAMAAPERAEAPERDPVEAEPAERLERLDERERERDYEPVSLPKFLSTLGVVARNAERLGDRLPEEAIRALPTLRGLLAQARPDAPVPTPTPAAGVAVLTRPPQPATRHRLLGSAAPRRDAPAPAPRRPGPAPADGAQRLCLSIHEFTRMNTNGAPARTRGSPVTPIRVHSCSFVVPEDGACGARGLAGQSRRTSAPFRVFRGST